MDQRQRRQGTLRRSTVGTDVDELHLAFVPHGVGQCAQVAKIGLASMRTRTSPGPGVGTGTSRHSKTSAGFPNRSKTIDFIAWDVVGRSSG